MQRGVSHDCFKGENGTLLFLRKSWKRSNQSLGLYSKLQAFIHRTSWSRFLMAVWLSKAFLNWKASKFRQKWETWNLAAAINLILIIKTRLKISALYHGLSLKLGEASAPPLMNGSETSSSRQLCPCRTGAGVLQSFSLWTACCAWILSIRATHLSTLAAVPPLGSGPGHDWRWWHCSHCHAAGTPQLQ